MRAIATAVTDRPTKSRAAAGELGHAQHPHPTGPWTQDPRAITGSHFSQPRRQAVDDLLGLTAVARSGELAWLDPPRRSVQIVFVI
jgi:hypothetical protein